MVLEMYLEIADTITNAMIAVVSNTKHTRRGVCRCIHITRKEGISEWSAISLKEKGV